MRSDYMNEVIRRGNELTLLDRAASNLEKDVSLVRWIVGAAFGVLVTFFPAICSAQAFFGMI